MEFLLWSSHFYPRQKIRLSPPQRNPQMLFHVKPKKTKTQKAWLPNNDDVDDTEDEEKWSSLRVAVTQGNKTALGFTLWLKLQIKVRLSDLGSFSFWHSRSLSFSLTFIICFDCLFRAFFSVSLFWLSNSLSVSVFWMIPIDFLDF